MSTGGWSSCPAWWCRRGTAQYRGLRHTPAFRAYCTLFGFIGGVLLITAGSVFCSVIGRHPQSGGHPMHTPPLLLAVAMILLGGAMVVASGLSVWIHWLETDEEGEGEDDTQNICSSDHLDQVHQEHLHQQLLFQQYIDSQLHKQRGLTGENSDGSCRCHSQSNSGQYPSDIKQCVSESGSRCRCGVDNHNSSGVNSSRGDGAASKHEAGCLAQQQVHSAKPASRSSVVAASSSVSRPRPNPTPSSALGRSRGGSSASAPPPHRHASIVISNNDEISVVIRDS